MLEYTLGGRNIAEVLAVKLGDVLESMDIGAVWLLVGVVVISWIVNLIIPQSIAKWALLAPIFIPLFIRLDVAPQTVLAAYRVGDSPTNVITPLNPYMVIILASRAALGSAGRDRDARRDDAEVVLILPQSSKLFTVKDPATGETKPAPAKFNEPGHRYTALDQFSMVLALVLQATVGGTEFLPKSDYGTIAVEVRTPSSASLEYARDKVEKAAELARSMPETEATNTRVNPGGGRIYVDIGKSSDRDRSASEYAAGLRVLLKQLVGAEYVVLDDLNNGAQKPVQIRFYGEDTRRLMEITSAFMDRMREIPPA